MKISDNFKNIDNIAAIKKWSDQYNHWGDEKYHPWGDEKYNPWKDEKYNPWKDEKYLPIDDDVKKRINDVIKGEIDSEKKETTTHCKIIEVDGKFLLEFPDGNRIEINLEDPESIGLAIISEIAKKLLKNEKV